MKRSLAVALALAVLTGTSAARAKPDVQACLAASEQGQRARSRGKLREAQASFLECGHERCPALVRRDCAQWQTEVSALLPTVVFGARDAEGRDVLDVTVSMDGEVLVEALDGKSVAVDPGVHNFTFARAGFHSQTERVLVKEGEKARAITVTFGAPERVDAARPAEREPARGGGPGALPWIVVGVGGAVAVSGLVYAITAPPLPAGCDRASGTCVRFDGESEAQYAERREQAGESDGRPVTGYVIAGAGVVVAGGGLLWALLAGGGDDGKRRALRVWPWAAPGAGGLSAGARF